MTKQTTTAVQYPNKAVKEDEKTVQDIKNYFGTMPTTTNYLGYYHRNYLDGLKCMCAIHAKLA